MRAIPPPIQFIDLFAGMGGFRVGFQETVLID